MVTSPTAAAQEYKLTLDELVNNNKTQINLLTILADDYREYGSYIVEAIEKQVYTVPKEQKLPILYVTDSILKNISKGPYKALFQKIIIKIFLHVFVNGDEKVRLSLYKLRQTWSDIFPNSCLYKLDMEVNKEDKQWPITSPKAVAAAGAAAAAGGAGAAPAAPTSPQIYVNPKFLQTKTTPPAQSERDPRARAQPKKKPVEVKKEPPSDPKGSRDVLDNIMTTTTTVPPSRVIKEEPEEPIPPPAVPAAVVKKQPAPPKRRTNEGADHRAPVTKKKRSPGPRDEDFRRRGAAPAAAVAAASVAPNRVLTPPVPSTAAPATALPGAHAFAVPVVAGPSGGSPNINLPPFTDTFSHPPSSQFTSTPSFTPMPASSTTSGFFNPPAPLVTGPAPLPHHPGAPMTHSPPPAAAAIGAPPARAVEISHEQSVKLEGIPANNRIFVDGKAHEVFYINDDTAVIERNGLPHRIYFSGPPRNVIIDGVAHLLHFGERKTVYIDGQPHVLRFGAPSKELYMGNYPFKGQFGGAPIIAIIDNRRHEIRLGGPAPEVKIEPEPAYDLTRFMPKAREGVAEPAKAAENPFELLRRLQESGFLAKAKAAAAAAAEEKRPNSRLRGAAAKEVSPPIPSEHTMDSVEKRLAPTTSLRDFNMRQLKIRYDAIVNSLHEKQRNACPHCGLRMELKGEKYERHMDWHVKKNLQTLERTSTSRPWYASSKDWLSNEDDDIPGCSTAADVKDDEANSAPAINSEDAPNKECVVCGERFEEFFCEEDDLWKLKGTTVVDDRVVHVGCLQDVSRVERPPSSLSLSPSSPNASSSDPIVVDSKTKIMSAAH